MTSVHAESSQPSRGHRSLNNSAARGCHCVVPPVRCRHANKREENAMAGLYYEEFFLDQEFDHPWSRTVTEMDNTLFSALTLNVQPLHLDAHFAAQTEFGQRIVNSMFTAGLMVGMSVNDTTAGTTVGNLGFTDMRFPKPVFHGDTLRARTKVVAMRESRSRPDVGIVDFEHTCWNQRGEMVAICRRQAMMRKKPQIGAASPSP
ncbi:MAG TPA: MaoC family dehydratase [Acetobacteraceae bacterium]|nr:MaoC family dehydratase [Acetobacteraceae bacterium]